MSEPDSTSTRIGSGDWGSGDERPDDDRSARAYAPSATSADETEDSHLQSWLAVVLMVIGFTVVGVGVVLFDLTSVQTSVIVLAVGTVIGLIGVVIGVRAGLMTSVE